MSSCPDGGACYGMGVGVGWGSVGKHPKTSVLIAADLMALSDEIETSTDSSTLCEASTISEGGLSLD